MKCHLSIWFHYYCACLLLCSFKYFISSHSIGLSFVMWPVSLRLSVDQPSLLHFVSLFYTEFQKKLHIFTFYLFTYFQNNTVQTFGTNMFGRHWLNFCKDYVVIESSEKHVFLRAKSNVGRNWKSQSYQCALCYYSWWFFFLSHSSKVVNIGCEQLSYDVGWKLWTVWTWCNAWWRHSG